MLDRAEASKDEAQVAAIRRTIDREVLECTSHTAARIKRIEKNVDRLCGEWDGLKMKIEGGRIALALLKYGASIGGGAVIAKMLGL